MSDIGGYILGGAAIIAFGIYAGGEPKYHAVSAGGGQGGVFAINRQSGQVRYCSGVDCTILNDVR